MAMAVTGLARMGLGIIGPAAMEWGAHEPFAAIYSPAGGHLAFDGGHFACRWRRLSAVAGFGAAEGGLPDDPGDDVLSGGKPGGDGLIRDVSFGAAVWTNTGVEPDDLDEL